MRDLLNIWQVYFDQKSKRNCYPEYNHYNNEGLLTENFENSVIIDLIDKEEHLKADYFGVFSHDICKDIPFKEDGLAFNPKNLNTIIERNQNVDVFSFQKRRSQKNIITQAENYHKGFVDIVKKILFETEFLNEIPKHLDKIVLFNYWIARPEIYQRYVDELLRPAVEVLKGLNEAYYNAGYKKLSDAEKARFLKAFGKPYYPYHPFVLERLPSLFLHKYNYEFKHIF